jgi:hypothetical protein
LPYRHPGNVTIDVALSRPRESRIEHLPSYLRMERHAAAVTAT